MARILSAVGTYRHPYLLHRLAARTPLESRATAPPPGARGRATDPGNPTGMTAPLTTTSADAASRRGWHRWWVGARPRTLSMAVAPVFVGAGIAWGEGVAPRWLVFALTLACAVLIQVGHQPAQRRLRLRARQRSRRPCRSHCASRRRAGRRRREVRARGRWSRSAVALLGRRGASSGQGGLVDPGASACCRSLLAWALFGRLAVRCRTDPAAKSVRAAVLRPRGGRRQPTTCRRTHGRVVDAACGPRHGLRWRPPCCCSTTTVTSPPDAAAGRRTLAADARTGRRSQVLYRHAAAAAAGVAAVARAAHRLRPGRCDYAWLMRAAGAVADRAHAPAAADRRSILCSGRRPWHSLPSDCCCAGTLLL